MDPESGLDAVRHVGLRGGQVAALSETPLAGTRVIDATGLVVAPGFIDLHEHGQAEESYRMMVRDGVTSAFELEVGTADVAAWYAARERGQIVNHGVSIGHIPVRMKVLGDRAPAWFPPGSAAVAPRAEAQMVEMEALLRQGLKDGAVAVGFGSAYTPGAPMSEIERMFRVAAEGGASAHIHLRGGLAGLHETIAAAKAAQVPLHVVHVNSVAGDAIDGFFAAITAARAAGQDVTTEAYPYGAGMTEITSALFDDWESWPNEKFGQHQLVSTGERLTRVTFAQARKAGGTIIIHSRTEAQTRAAIVNPLAMIASDGFIENGRGHPRTSGTYAKVLGRYVRRGEGRAPDGRPASDDAFAGKAARGAGPGDEAEGTCARRRRCRPHDLRSGDGPRSRHLRGRQHPLGWHSVRDRQRPGGGGRRTGSQRQAGAWHPRAALGQARDSLGLGEGSGLRA